MAKITALPAADPLAINGTEVVPIVKGGTMQQATLAQLTQAAVAQAEAAAAAAIALNNYRPTFDAATADFAIGEYFTCDEDGGLNAYERIADAPGYEHRPALDPVTRADLGIVVRGTGDADADTARLQAAAVAVEDGGRIRLIGEFVLNAQTAFVGRDEIKIVCEPGVAITIADVAWPANTPAILFRDCTRCGVLGMPRIDCNLQDTVAVMAISTDATGWTALEDMGSADFTVEVEIRNCATRGVAVRGVKGVKARVVGRFKNDDCHFVEIARSDDVDVWLDLDGLRPDGTMAPGTDNGGSGICVSPGIWGGEFATGAGINFLYPTTFNDACRRTAPVAAAATNVATFSFLGDDYPATIVPYPAHATFEDHTWRFHIVEQGPGGRDIRPKQITVTAVDSVAKTITVALVGMDGVTPQNWDGEVLYLYGFLESHMCNRVRVTGTVVNTSGAGSFLLACKGGVNDRLVTKNNRDIGSDIEWGVDCGNLYPVDLTDDDFAANASAAVLYSLGDNYNIGGRGKKRTIVLGSGEIGGKVTISDTNTPISVGTNRALPCLIDHLVIENCQPPAGVNGFVIYPAGVTLGEGGGGESGVKNCIKLLDVEGCHFSGLSQNGLLLQAVGYTRIHNCTADGIGLRLVNIRGTAGQDGGGEVVNCRLREFTRVWIGNPLVRFGSAAAAPTWYFENIDLADAGVDSVGGTMTARAALYRNSAGTILPSPRRPNSATGAMIGSNNLSEITTPATARTNLGLGSTATLNTGTSGGTVALCNGANNWSANNTFSASLIATGGTIWLNGAGASNLLIFNTSGTGAPTFTTRSAGTKITIYPSLTGAAVDYGIGGEAGALWFSTPTNTSAHSFKFYGGTTAIATLRGDGQLSIAGAVIPGSFTVATMPASNDGAIAFATNGRKGAEGVGAGTGVMAYRDGGAWYRMSDDTVLAA